MPASCADELIPYSDSITSILTCRFILPLCQFYSTIALATLSVLGSQVREREHPVSRILEFAARPSGSLLPSIASFANLVYVDSVLSEMDQDAFLDGGPEPRGMDVGSPGPRQACAATEYSAELVSDYACRG